MPTPTPNPSPFLERLILFQLPYFLPASPSEAVARSEILETLASYRGRSRSEVINAARIIAFSFAALDTLADAEASDLSPSLRLRYKGCANNLNRSCQQNEQILASRLANDLPDIPKPEEEPVDEIPNPEVRAAIEPAEASIASYHGGLATRSPNLPSRELPPEQQASNQRLWGAAMMDVLRELGMPVQPAPQ